MDVSGNLRKLITLKFSFDFLYICDAKNLDMNTPIVTVDFPSDILLTLKTKNELKQDIKLPLAIRLYQLQKLTKGKAAQIDGLSRFNFETVLSDNGIPISNPPGNC